MSLITSDVTALFYNAFKPNLFFRRYCIQHGFIDRKGVMSYIQLVFRHQLVNPGWDINKISVLVVNADSKLRLITENRFFCTTQGVHFRAFHIHFDEGGIFTFRGVIDGTNRNLNGMFICRRGKRRAFALVCMKIQSGGFYMCTGTNGSDTFCTSFY